MSRKRNVALLQGYVSVSFMKKRGKPAVVGPSPFRKKISVWTSVSMMPEEHTKLPSIESD